MRRHGGTAPNYRYRVTRGARRAVQGSPIPWYANEDNGYTVARVDTGRGGGDLLTVVGGLLGAQVGESLRMEGRWGSHPQYGKQFTVENY
ncbi:hypothetical protein ABT147_36935, partial [Streptomyces sp. NPDC001868]|uniref:YrrC family ATP-dependent DNA helicase n=1 Tax=Streptomyces sp. NPDC001868 TaxID=3154401 RepID=UPI003332491D